MDYREGVTFLKESIQFDKCNFPIEIVLETGYEQGDDLVPTLHWKRGVCAPRFLCGGMPNRNSTEKT